MSVLKLLLGASGSFAEHVVSRVISPSGVTAVVSYSGASAGDLALVYANNDAGGSPGPYMVAPAGWANENFTDSNGYFTQLFSKVLTSADITAGSGSWTNVRLSNGGLILAVYRGVTEYVSKGETSGTSTSLTFAGFTPSPLGAGVVTFISDRSVFDSPTAPAGFSRRAVGPSQGFTMSVADNLPANNYTGADVTWTGLTSTPTYAWLIELQ